MLTSTYTCVHGVFTLIDLIAFSKCLVQFNQLERERERERERELTNHMTIYYYNTLVLVTEREGRDHVTRLYSYSRYHPSIDFPYIFLPNPPPTLNWAYSFKVISSDVCSPVPNVHF